MIKFPNQVMKRCTGCSCCANMCKADAIQMIPDHYGFLRPRIDSALCTSCGRCISSCPIRKPEKQNNDGEPNCYACMAEDTLRAVSSSGGAFSVFAQEVLSKRGVVCGASLEKDLHVRHVFIDKQEQLPLLQKSKYIQSEIGTTYRKVEFYLQSGRTVFFTGCPCQIAGLKSFLGKDYANLITVDLLCHGVASYQMFANSIGEEVPLESIHSVNFRNKEDGWNYNAKMNLWSASCQIMELDCDGMQKRLDVTDNGYEKGYHKNLILQESCYDCFFSEFPRQGDISIGDFWGIDQYSKDLTDNRGTSMVLLNSEKGKNFFESVKDQFRLCQQTPLSAIRNRTEAKLEKHPGRERFLELYPSMPFNQVVERVIREKFDIGIVGVWYVRNHGSQMTYFALYHTIRDLGYQPLLICQPEDSIWKPGHEPYQFMEEPYHPYEMAFHPDIASMKIINNQCDTFLLGSDQFWNPVVCRTISEHSLLRWVHSDKRKVAYAASFAHDDFKGKPDEKSQIGYFVSRFDSISVREKSGVDLLQRECGREAEWVLDPVFLCDRKYFDQLADKGTGREPKQKFLFAYILDPSKEKEEVIRYCCSQSSLGLRVAIDGENDPDRAKSIWLLDMMKEVYNEEWLAMFRDSDFVITDSFHGFCFAILYHKPFFAIVNESRGASRFTSLASQLGLMDRIVKSVMEIPRRMKNVTDIDYDAVFTKLEQERERSLKWIKFALQKPVARRIDSTFDILDDRCDKIIDLQRRDIGQLQVQNQTINKRLDDEHQHCQFLQKIIDNNIPALYENQKRFNEDLQKIYADYSGRTDSLEERLEASERQVADLRKSHSYRIGRTITWVPRKLREGYHCLRENGIKYTVMDLIKKISASLVQNSQK